MKNNNGEVCHKQYLVLVDTNGLRPRFECAIRVVQGGWSSFSNYCECDLDLSENRYNWCPLQKLNPPSTQFAQGCVDQVLDHYNDSQHSSARRVV